MGVKEGEEHDAYTIIWKVLHFLARRKHNGQAIENIGHKFLRYITKASGTDSRSTIVERSMRASINYNLTELDQHERDDAKATMTDLTDAVASLKREDEDFDYEHFADRALATSVSLGNRQRKRASDSIDKWIEEAIDGDIGSLSKWIKKEDVRVNPTVQSSENVTDASIGGVLEKNTTQWETIWKCNDDTKREETAAMLKA